jgi:A/G-specific adenine glycosylase
LVDAAQHVVKDFGGLLPCSLNLLLRLPGMGEYSARAVACLAFGARVPMIDESTGRLLRRVLGLKPVRPAHSDSTLLEVAKKMVPADHARNFNLGLLDIASKFCHWTNPACPSCPLAEYCAYGGSLDSSLRNPRALRA